MNSWRIAAVLMSCTWSLAGLCADAAGQVNNDEVSFPAAFGSDADESGVSIDWTKRKATQLDILFQSEGRLIHGRAGISRGELAAYLELIANIRFRQQLDGSIFSAVGRSAYENEFYGVPALRQRLYEAAHDRAATVSDPTVAASVPYRFADDLLENPEFFVGRPIVLFGSMQFLEQTSASGSLTVSDASSASGTRTISVTYPLNRGQLVDPSTGELLATVDTRRYRMQTESAQVFDAWPFEESKRVPVIVKGWFVKLQGRLPLVYCEDVQLLGPVPRRELIQQTATHLKPLLPEEAWLYYETLHQLERTDHTFRQTAATRNVLLRIDELMDETQREMDNRVLEADEWLARNPGRESEHQSRIRTATRSAQRRIARYAKYREEPDTFYTFNDLFNHPDEWQGRCVTLRGHVRQPIEFDADPKFLGGRKLYELSLFTDDSQGNPAIIVTAALPPSFPLSEQRVEAVTVTGCCFKHYVYQAANERRIAPLILAERIEWNPSAVYLRQLVSDGVLPPDSEIAAGLSEESSDLFSRTAVVTLLFLGVLVAMYLRGRQQRDLRARDRLRHMTASDVSPHSLPELSEQQDTPQIRRLDGGEDDMLLTDEG